jgi:hypothetical protein
MFQQWSGTRIGANPRRCRERSPIASGLLQCKLEE